MNQGNPCVYIITETVAGGETRFADSLPIAIEAANQMVSTRRNALLHWSEEEGEELGVGELESVSCTVDLRICISYGSETMTVNRLE